MYRPILPAMLLLLMVACSNVPPHLDGHQDSSAATSSSPATNNSHDAEIRNESSATASNHSVTATAQAPSVPATTAGSAEKQVSRDTTTHDNASLPTTPDHSVVADDTTVETAEQPTASTTSDTHEQAADQNDALTAPHPLERFSGSYRVYISKIPMPITATIELAPTADTDTWHMVFTVDSLGIHNREESLFTWNDCHPKSQHYLHDFKGFGKKQHHETEFSWDPPRATNMADGNKNRFAIPEDAVDDLTVLLQAACFLGEGRDDYHVTSIYGEKIRHNHFKRIGEETIDTPLGKLDTLIVEKLRKKNSRRRTLFWIAPALNFMMVKAKHIENSALSGEVIMKQYSGPHQ